MIEFHLNGRGRSLDTDPATPLLWVIRDTLGLTGTKFGCGMGVCGACTVHLDGEAIRSCVTPLSAAAGKAVTTIEGLGGDHPLQRAWVAHNVPQCGYCQSGQIMAAAALLASNPAPDTDEIRQSMAGNLCRCGTYNKIQRAIHSAADSIAHWQPDAPEPQS
ncbi:(2Fe-2S)-binding protein [Kineobactrum sediminis]|uniref:(2Fe-2S)-binding protein n=1 Tax=Kineobactrum sediminis TaxID=1905677 RepID=A0A2N5Y2I1_9GAMM|nr:(2Fe-2S)-binding protein [Kineobactrum sediminis]PLW82595.1 (2Fe-2S)-binding protein [Kineobactrum sediminis]